MTDALIRDTVVALDQALARIAVDVSGSQRGAAALLTALARGEATAETAAFLTEGAALLRARRLLAQARWRSLRRAA